MQLQGKKTYEDQCIQIKDGQSQLISGDQIFLGDSSLTLKRDIRTLYISSRFAQILVQCRCSFNSLEEKGEDRKEQRKGEQEEEEEEMRTTKEGTQKGGNNRT